METEMTTDNCQQEGMSIDPDQVVKVIQTFYTSNNPVVQNEANKQLTQLQSSDQIWNICWPLLDPSRYNSVEANFFAANALVNKINQSWSQQDEDWLEHQLRPKILEMLVKHASSPNSDKIVERLSLALATFALHSIPTFWPNAIEDILQQFTPQNLPVAVPPERICDILLKILLYIPEEYSVLIPQRDHRAKLNAQMSESAENVFKFLYSLLVSNINLDCRQMALKCLTSWILHSKKSVLEMENAKTILDLLYGLVMDEELCPAACASLAATFTNPKSEDFRNSVIDFMPKVAQLKDAVDIYKKKDDIECAIKIYSLITNFSENHSRLYLKIVLNEGIELATERYNITTQAIFSILNTILECTSAPGIYGLDEKYSDIAFPFWFTFFEGFYYYADIYTDSIVETFSSLFDSLLEILIIKARYPSVNAYYREWDDDQRESYRCYRQDLGDTISLMMHFPRARGRILNRLHDRLAFEHDQFLKTSINDDQLNWQAFESTVFTLMHMSESIPYDEDKYVGKIFNMLSHMPLRQCHPLLYCTVAELMSSYSDWLYSNSDHMATAFNILFMGVNSSESHVRLMSTLALKDLASECQLSLEPLAPRIINACSEAILRPDISLPTNVKSRLMHTLGTTLAVCSKDQIVRSLDTLTSPLICDLADRVQIDLKLDQTCRETIMDRMTMLNSLFESLYVRPTSHFNTEDENDTSHYDLYDTKDEENIFQPLLTLLKRLLPIFRMICTKYVGDEDMIAIITSTIKRSGKILGIELKPLISDIMVLIVNSYNPMINYNMLDGAVPLYLLFCHDESLQPLMMNSFCEISNKIIDVCINNPLRQLSPSIERYFKFATSIFKKYFVLFAKYESPINLELVYKLAIASLELPEKRTLAEVCNFLTVFRQRSKGYPKLDDVFNSQLEVMLANMFNIMGGIYSTPRNAIDHVTDLLFYVISSLEVKQPFKAIIEKDNFPTIHVSQEQKANFVSRIVHEKNRNKFKVACNEFVLAARNLSRAS